MSDAPTTHLLGGRPHGPVPAAARMAPEGVLGRSWPVLWRHREGGTATSVESEAGGRLDWGMGVPAAWPFGAGMVSFP